MLKSNDVKLREIMKNVRSIIITMFDIIKCSPQFLIINIVICRIASLILLRAVRCYTNNVINKLIQLFQF